MGACWRRRWLEVVDAGAAGWVDSVVACSWTPFLEKTARASARGRRRHRICCRGGGWVAVVHRICLAIAQLTVCNRLEGNPRRTAAMAAVPNVGDGALNRCSGGPWDLFGTPYGGGDNDDNDDNEDDMKIARRESLRTTVEDEHKRKMYSRSQSVREAGGSSGSKSRGGLFGRFRNVFSASGRKQTERVTPTSSINLEEEETQFTIHSTFKCLLMQQLKHHLV
ncbi:hypothetical protein ACLOJK_034045 [Asimina triloba]